MPTGILLASGILISADPFSFGGSVFMPAYQVIGYVNSMFAILLMLMLLSTYFSTEAPEWLLPPRQRAAWRGRLRFAGVLGPGSARGFTFAILSNFLALVLYFPLADRILSPLRVTFPEAFTDSGTSVPVLYAAATGMALVFLVSSAGLLFSVVFKNDMVRKGVLSMGVIALLFLPLATFGTAHSFKDIETADIWDFGFLSPVVAVGSLGNGYWETVRPNTRIDFETKIEEEVKSVFPFQMNVAGRTVPVFAAFSVSALLAGLGMLAVFARRRRRLLRTLKCPDAAPS
jgi:hypothetical protein